MINRYFSTIKLIKQDFGELSKTFSRDEITFISDTLIEIDTILLSGFRKEPADCDDDTNRKVRDLSLLLLNVSFERFYTIKVGNLIKNICSVLSLFNSRYYKNNNMETIIAATVSIITSKYTLDDLLGIFKIWMPKLRQLTAEPMAFDLSGHYLNQLKDRNEEV